jgi:hypothetical protein
MKIRTTVLAALSAFALVGAMAAPAGASTPPLDASNATVSCDSVVGSIKFVPPLTSGGTSAGLVYVKATVSGCSTSLATTVLSGSGKGTLATATNDCSGLVGLSTSTSGPLITKWKTASGSPKITPAASTLNITQTYGAQFTGTPGPGDPAGNADAWGASYGLFQIGTDAAHGGTSAPNVVGAFTGGNSGHTTTLDATTGQSATSLALSCLLTGIKSIAFGIGQVTLQ